MTPRDLEGLNKLMWQDRFIRVSMETCDCGKEFLGAAVTGEKVVGVPSLGPRRADAKAGTASPLLPPAALERRTVPGVAGDAAAGRLGPLRLTTEG